MRLPRQGERRHPPVWIFVSAAWLGPGILAAFQGYVQGRLGSREPATWRSLTWDGGDWLLYALLTPAVFWVARRFPLSRETLARRVPLHLIAAVLLCGAWAGGGILLSWVLFRSTPYGGGAVSWFLTSLPFGVAVYFSVLGVEHAARYFLEARERETQTARLSSQLAEARLSALRMQLNPHFLFNSLNATLVLVRDQDTPTATRMLEQLSDVLRHVLRTDRPQEVTLAEEIGFLERYLAIEQVRFSDRLQVAFRLDPEVLDAAVPDLILQPLVENAVRHGVANRTEAGVVSIDARREGDELVIAVADDGNWITEAGPRDQAGIGLTNTRERLQMLYGEGGRLDISSSADGTIATIRIPYREIQPPAGKDPRA